MMYEYTKKYYAPLCLHSLINLEFWKFPLQEFDQALLHCISTQYLIFVSLAFFN